MRKNGSRWCPLYGKCGGCEFVNESYDYELDVKQYQIDQLLQKFGPVNEIVPCPKETGYRYKIQAVCGRDRDGKFITGQYRKGSHKLFPIRDCRLEDGRATAVLQTVRQAATRFALTPYDEDRHIGDLRYVLIRCGYNTPDTMVVLVTGKKDFPHKSDLVSLIHQKNPQVVTIVQIVNTEDSSMVIPDNAKEEVLYGSGYIVDKLCGLKFRISATSFYQINPLMAEKLYLGAMKVARLREDDIVIDAYSGTGTIGLIAASMGVKSVIGIESNSEAIKDAEKNAELNKISNISFICDDAAKYLKGAAKKKEQCSVVFLDPPRAGSSEEFLAAMGKMEPEIVCYISCNPETLERDLRYFLKFYPYEVVDITPYDLFPATEHVETVVLMSRVEK